MSWLGGWFGGGNSDPLKNLDPKLRDFLDKESPTKHSSSEVEKPKPQVQPPPPVTRPKIAPPPAKSETQPEADKPAVPAASLYQDGRYAHLWKNYRPLADIEGETKTDNEKMMDLLDEYKSRRSAIGRTALESCAEEQADWSSCMKDGNIKDRFTMCRDQVRKFERCYMVQSKLLKALGYLSTPGARSPEMDERIQMHADMLYHRMIEREAAVAKAKEEGKPIPTFGPLVTPLEAASAAAPPQSATTAAVAKAQESPAPQAPEAKDDPLAKWLALGDHQAGWDKKMAKLTPEEQHVEEQAMRQELRANAQVKGKLDAKWEQRREERKQRIEQGQGTLADRVASLLGR